MEWQLHDIFQKIKKNEIIKMIKFYIIATPIGNLKEINQRAIDAFSNSNIIYCEDTRVTKKLFNLLNISLSKKIFISINGFNEKEIVEKINFNNNESVSCLVSDAGYPMISDPGYILTNELIKRNVKIEVVNGSCSIIHALVISGFPTNNFYFSGFISNSDEERKTCLLNLKSINSTLIILESVHKIRKTLESIKEIFGENVQIIVAKELTKLNECIYRGSIDHIIENIDYRGEFVIVINNNSTKKINDFNLYLNEVNKLIKKGTQEKVACKMVGYKYDVSSKELFNTLQVKKNII